MVMGYLRTGGGAREVGRLMRCNISVARGSHGVGDGGSVWKPAGSVQMVAPSVRVQSRAYPWNASLAKASGFHW